MKADFKWSFIYIMAITLAKSWTECPNFCPHPPKKWPKNQQKKLLAKKLKK